MHLRSIATTVVCGFLAVTLASSHLEGQRIRDRIRQRREDRRNNNKTPSESASTAGPTSCAEPNAGFRIITFRSGLRAAAWYPSTSATENYDYANGVSSGLAVNSPVADCGNFPVVVFSHGFGGCGIQSAFFTEELARAGYVVIAPDHKDAKCKVDQPREGRFRFERAEEPFRKPEKWSDKTYVDRRDDIRGILDELPKTSEFSGKVDMGRVGAMGHSLGGYTMMGLAGGWESWHDRRIKALLLFSPFAAPFLEHKGVRNIDVAVMYQGGDRDRGITPYLSREDGVYARSNAPKYYVELKNQGHLDWTVRACQGSGTIADCNRGPKAREINAYGISFLNKYLGGKSRAGTLKDLGTERDAGVKTFRRQER